MRFQLIKFDIAIAGTHLTQNSYHSAVFYFQLEHGAEICKPCDIGVSPIHAAGRASSTNTLKVLLTKGITQVSIIDIHVHVDHSKKHNTKIQLSVYFLMDMSWSLPL